MRQNCWLSRPRTPAGQPDVDRLNPDPGLRPRPLCGLTIIWGLRDIGPMGGSTTRKTATPMMSLQSASPPTGYPHAFIAEFFSSAAPKS